jgi:AcrR family transcriptional regulator
MPPRDHDTRQRLIKTAASLFADKGFHNVTVREICQGANANVAAVNYHFRDKFGLYRAIVETAIEVMRETNEATLAAGRGQPPGERLRAYVQAFLERLDGNDRASWVNKLMAREMEEPTEALELVGRKVMAPRHEYLAQIVSEISHLQPTDQRVTRAVISIQSQCFVFARRGRMPSPWSEAAADLSAAADHIATFSLAGIRVLGE